MSYSNGPWFVVDPRSVQLVVEPSLVDVFEPTRLAIYDRVANSYVYFQDIPSGERVRVDLGEYACLYDYTAKLQKWDDGWHDCCHAVRLSQSKDSEVHVISPSSWGIIEDCEVVVRDPAARKLIHKSVVPAGKSVNLLLEFAGGKKLQLDFRSADPGGDTVVRGIVPPVRLVPYSQRVAPPSLIENVVGDLFVSQRNDVVLVPGTPMSGPRSGILSTQGYVGAWEREQPIPEVMEFALGRQSYLFHSRPLETIARVSGEAIYLGFPHASWGHFLTQGLSRLWFALRNPDVPVLWDAPRLLEYQEELLKSMGVRNPQLFLT